MDGVDCDWCLVCDKHTGDGQVYCSDECRLTDLMSSSASSSSSTSSSGSAYFGLEDASSISSTGSSPQANLGDNYPMPPFVRKQRTSIPNIYAQTPNPATALYYSMGGNSASALSHHLLLQQQQLQQQPPLPGSGLAPTSNPSQYPLYHAALNGLRPASPSTQDHVKASRTVASSGL